MSYLSSSEKSIEASGAPEQATSSGKWLLMDSVVDSLAYTGGLAAKELLLCDFQHEQVQNTDILYFVVPYQ